MRALLAQLPHGRTLPDASWRARHRALLVVLWAHVPGLALFAVHAGQAPAHALLDVAPVAVLALLGSMPRAGRRLPVAFVALGLLTCSALAVHLSGGMIEAHFHFFVAVAALALYEDWTAFGLALGYVVLHHGLFGALAPESVFAHASGARDPWRWASVHGAFIGALSLISLFTWRANERAREEVVEREELLANVVRSSGDAIFTLRPDGTVMTWNDAAAQLFGHTAEQAVGQPVAFIVPDDRRDELPEISRLVLGEGRSFERETVRLHRDGTRLDVGLSVAPVRDAAGAVVGRTATARDIGARKRAEAALAAERERFAAAFEQAPIGMALTDLHGVLLQVNAALRELLGRDDLVGRDVAGVIDPDDFAAGAADMRALLAGRIPRVTLDQRQRHADGHTVYVRSHLSVARDADGVPVHLVAQLEDVSAAKAREQELVATADALKAANGIDATTGLRTRRELDRELRRRAADPTGPPFAIALLTLAGLRRINDERGHADGDRVLRALAARLRDEAADRGGEAFRHDGAVLAVLAPPGVVAEVVAALREAAPAVDPLVAVVAGVAAWPQDGPSADLLVLRAEVEAQAERRSRAAADAPADAPSTLPARVAALLETAREHLGLDVSWLSELRGEELLFRALDGDAESFGLAAGATVPRAAVPCGGVLAGTLPEAIGDVRAHPRAGALPAVDAAGLGAYVGVPIELDDGRTYGMLCAAGHAARPDLGPQDARVLRAMAALVARMVDEDRRHDEQRRVQAEGAGLSALLAALDARDHYTGEHSEAVLELAGAVARRLGLGEEAAAEVEQVALLHDIGKIGIPDAVLQKRGPLDDLEWELMRQHSALGARIVASIGSLAHLAPAIRAEHERWDGAGYPDGLAGDDIPFAARIILATDAWHAMTSDRPYRAALPLDRAVAELERCAGSQFDPAVVAALLALVAPPAPVGAGAPAG